jgi:DNA-binding transcriptional LysR family regulator
MSLTERLADMAVFARVVERAGFSAAGRELGLSKAAVSKAVARLEAHLGTRLLHRTTRRLTPTEAGAAFHAYCREVVAQAQEAEQHLGQLQAEPRGTLRLAAPLAFGLTQLSRVLPAFQQRHPELQVELELHAGAVDMVAGGFDLQLAIGEPDDSSLVARRLSTSLTIVVASPAYLAEHGAPRHPDDLQRHACLLTPQGQATGWQFHGRDGSRTVFVHGPLRANSEMALRDSALVGLGIARMPSFLVADDLAAGRLKCLFADWAAAAEPIYALYPSRRHLPAKVKAAIDHFGEVFGLLPYWDRVLSSAQCHC